MSFSAALPESFLYSTADCAVRGKRYFHFSIGTKTWLQENGSGIGLYQNFQDQHT